MSERKGMGSHQSAKIKKDEWLTPPELLKACGSFDLDPCAPINRPWDMAANHYTVEDNGLFQPWHGRVWCNPPYGKHTGIWLEKLKSHGDGVALIFARTETKDWFNYVWNGADSILFLKGRLYFHHVDGSQAKSNSGAPSALIAYGEHNTQMLKDAIKNKRISGKLIELI